MDMQTNLFKQQLSQKQQIGMFSTFGPGLVTELLGHCGFDWILLDTEHSPNEIGDVISQLQALAATDTNAIVRPAWSDMILTKRLLDVGARTLLFPYIQSRAEAEAAVGFTRYPPEGTRGVSGSSRGAGYGLIPGYFQKVQEQICVLLQIETVQGLRNLREIASVPGVDGIFLGPADLAASMGHIGNSQHPEVQAALDEAFATLRDLNIPSGTLTTDEAEAQRRLDQGVAFVGIATDVSIVSRAAIALTQRLSPKKG